MADLMAMVRRALGRESTPIDVPPIPRVKLTSDSKFNRHERRIGVLEDKVKAQTGRLNDHMKGVLADYEAAEKARTKR